MIRAVWQADGNLVIRKFDNIDDAEVYIAIYVKKTDVALFLINGNVEIFWSK